jgi:hypothetical protein
VIVVENDLITAEIGRKIEQMGLETPTPRR